MATAKSFTNYRNSGEKDDLFTSKSREIRTRLEVNNALPAYTTNLLSLLPPRTTSHPPTNTHTMELTIEQFFTPRRERSDNPPAPPNTPETVIAVSREGKDDDDDGDDDDDDDEMELSLVSIVDGEAGSLEPAIIDNNVSNDVFSISHFSQIPATTLPCLSPTTSPFTLTLRLLFRTPAQHGIGKIQGKMAAVGAEMLALWGYTKEHCGGNRLLHHWPQYTRYTALEEAVKLLNKAVSKSKDLACEPLKADCSPEVDLETINNILRAATSISKRAASIIRALSNQIEKSEEQIGASHMSAREKAHTKNRIIIEVDRLSKISTAAVDATSSARKRLLRKAFAVEDSNLQNTPRWKYLIIMVLGFFLIALMMLGMMTIQLREQARVGQKQSRAMIRNLQTQVFRMQTQLDNTVVNQRNDLYALEQLFQPIEVAIAQAIEVYGQRIDNIWEALGPPNANGTYYTTTNTPANFDDNPDNDIEHDEKIKELRQKLTQLRQYVLRIDLRLTKQIGRLEKKWKF
ncbi:hypothetical protein B0J11DRAFT_567503 [Dendryphion nanum]|uniref:Uncharacterized protein n=1 Tax=Dendryphion nanum TaxID=256645 RepID=A0A9P9DX70_9PLEO|nr:hypothetical protein B0J11DRAFT_567503 [Dendryphion nanum]